MFQNRYRISQACWVIAGVPVLITCLQAVFALAALDALEIPVVAGLKKTVDSITVIDKAGIIFRNSSTAVILLFLLVTISWLGVGAGMFLFQNRQFTYASTGLVTLFFALFLIVYMPLFSANIPAEQLVGFVSVPVVAVGTMWVGVSSYRWEETLSEETVEILSETREATNRAKNTFHTSLEGATDSSNLATLEESAPLGVSEFKEERDNFEKECSDIIDEVDALGNKKTVSSQHERLQQAKHLREQATNLRPSERADEILATYRKALAQQLRQEYSSFNVMSPYGEEYAIRNIKRFNELPLPEVEGPPVQIGGDKHELGKRLGDIAESNVRFREIAAAITRVEEHYAELESTLKKQEEALEEAIGSVESNLESAREALERIDGRAGDRLEEVLFENRFGNEEPPFPTVQSVDEQIEESKEQMHNCHFDEALRTAEMAQADANQIKQIAVFFADSVVATIEHGSGSIPIPDEVGSEVVEQLGAEIRHTYDIRYEIDGQTLNIDASEDNDEEPTRPSQRDKSEQSAKTGSNHSRGGVPPSEDVLYLLRELQDVYDDGSSTRTASLQLGEYPTKFSEDSLLDHLSSFCERESAVESVEVPDKEPGYFELEVTDGKEFRRVIDQVIEKYRKQYE